MNYSQAMTIPKFLIGQNDFPHVENVTIIALNTLVFKPDQLSLFYLQVSIKYWAFYVIITIQIECSAYSSTISVFRIYI